MFRKCISVILLVVFLAYSGGVGFSLHNCDHCHAVKMYVFQHPDCCPAAKEEHHHGETKHCCSHHHNDAEHCPNDTQKPSPEASTAHCKQCCASNFVYFKIKSDYIPSAYDKLLSDNYLTDILSVDLLWEQEQLPPLEAMENKISLKETPPLLAGGERFLIFSHQLLFYA